MHFLENTIFVAVFSLALGSFLTLLVQRYLNKRGVFSYYVWHNRVGVSTDDPVFGSVQVTWDNNPVANLYSSTVELRNDSLNDYENVIVGVIAGDTNLLTESSEIVGTTHILEWTEAFKKSIEVPSGGEATDYQRELFNEEREYLIPVFNRGQVARFTFLNAAKKDKQPSILLDILHKGVKVKFRVPHEKFMGVSRQFAVLVGTIIGIILLVIIIMFVDIVWVAALVLFIYGLFVLLPGALVIKLWRWVRDMLGG